jgi:threonine dehydrogenase-like Zn-dependent dehydrogenase
MQAVVFKGPFKVVLEERPIPTIQDPTDVIVKVRYTALCGRYVHWPRFRILHHFPPDPGFGEG